MTWNSVTVVVDSECSSQLNNKKHLLLVEEHMKEMKKRRNQNHSFTLH